MKISTKGRYALRVMVDLARNGGCEECCAVKEIAARQGISRENVAVTLFRTREKLKNFLQEEGVSL